MGKSAIHRQAIELSDEADRLSNGRVKRLFVESPSAGLQQGEPGYNEPDRWSVTAYGDNQMLIGTSAALAFFSAHVTPLRTPPSTPNVEVVRNDPSVGAGVVLRAHALRGDVANAWDVLVAAVGARAALAQLRKRCEETPGGKAGRALYAEIREAHNL